MTSLRTLWPLTALAILSPILGGQSSCEGDDPLEISGSWEDNFGGTHDISDLEWLQGGFGSVSAFYVESQDNSTNVLIAQNSPENDWNPGLWSRFDWTEMDAAGGWYFCQTAYNAETYEAALGTPAADADDLSSGCSGFSWSYMSPQ